MPITDPEKIDFLLKKVGYEVAKTDKALLKGPSNESISSPILISSSNLWLDSIPSDPTVAGANSIVEKRFVRLDPIITSSKVSGQFISWKAPFEQWIPSSYGSAYVPNVYVADSGNGLTSLPPASAIFPDGTNASNNGYILDYSAGVVHFADTTIPVALTGVNRSVYLEAYRYVGAKGSTDTARKSLDLTQFSNTPASGLRSIINEVSGSGSLVFANNPTISGATINGNLTVSSNGNLTVDGSGNFVNGLYSNGTLVSISGHTHTSNDITDFSEAVQDTIGSGNFISSGFLRNGSGLGWTYNDTENTLSVGVTGIDTSLIPGLSGYLTNSITTQLVPSTGIGFSYDSDNDQLSIRVTGISSTLVTNLNQAIRPVIETYITGNILSGDGITTIPSGSDKIVINTNNTVVRTSGNQSISGVKTFANRPVFNSGIILKHGQDNAILNYAGGVVDNVNLIFEGPSDDPLYVAYRNHPERILQFGSASEIKTDLVLNNVQNIALSGVTITAGSGLVGGGSIDSSKTLNIGQGDGISVSDDAIAVNNTVVRTSGAQTIVGTKTFSGDTIFKSNGQDNNTISFYTENTDTGTLSFEISHETFSTNIVGNKLILDVDNANGGSGKTTTLLTSSPNSNIVVYLPSGSGVLARLSDINTTQITGVLSVNKGGTGRTSYSNGQLLIGSGTSLVANTLSKGYGIEIDNNAGSIVVRTTGLQPSGNYSVVGHPHVWNHITDASSIVSTGELAYLSGVVPGTASANRAVVVDNNRNIVNINNLTTSGNVTVGGDLIVQGTTTTVNSTVVNIGDNVIRINTSGLPFGGFEVHRSGSAPTAYETLLWNTTNSRWEFSGPEVRSTGDIVGRTLQSTVSGPTPPFVVASTGLVANLNSDLLDGQEGSYYLDWTKTTNKPTITGILNGDVTGTGSVTLGNLGGSLTINATIQPNSVTLGTDTTGQYASTISVNGTGLSANSANANDGTAYSIGINATPACGTGTIVARDSSGDFCARVITASGFIGSGNLLTNLNASNITTGTLSTGIFPTHNILPQLNSSVTGTFLTSVAVDSIGRLTSYALGTHTIATTGTNGIARFSSDNFSVDNGLVTIKSSGITNNQLTYNSINIGSTTLELGSIYSGISGINFLSGSSSSSLAILSYCHIDGGTP